MFASGLRRITPVLMAAPLVQRNFHSNQQMINETNEQVEYEPKFSVHITDALLYALLGKDTRTRSQVNVGGLESVNHL